MDFCCFWGAGAQKWGPYPKIRFRDIFLPNKSLKITYLDCVQIQSPKSLLSWNLLNLAVCPYMAEYNKWLNVGLSCVETPKMHKTHPTQHFRTSWTIGEYFRNCACYHKYDFRRFFFGFWNGPKPTKVTFELQMAIFESLWKYLGLARFRCPTSFWGSRVTKKQL